MVEARDRRTTVTAALVAAVVLAVVGIGAFLLLRGDGTEPALPPDEEPEEPAAPEEPAEPEPDPTDRAPLTGLPVDEPLDQPALLVKVSNSPEARPHTGLEEADLVYEELTEGGVTRFIAVFHSRVPPVVGPIRSARPVDVQVMSGFQVPGFAHSGARAEVRALLADVPAVTITEGAAGFFRDDGTYASHAYAPHNLFIRAPEVLEAVTAGGAQPLGDLGWVFADDPPDGGTDGGGTDGGGTDGGAELRVPMSDVFTTTWTYEPADGRYRRAQNHVPSFVTGEGEIAAANVVVLAVRHYVGASGYPETDVLGEGEALVLRDGRRYPARWSKPTATDPLLVLTQDGEVFPLKPGPTWLHLPDELPPTADDGTGA